MARLLFYLLSVYGVVLAVFYLAQRSLQYYPDRNYPGKPASNGAAGMEELRVRTEDGLDLLAWFAPPRQKDGRVVVMYHGNAGNIAGRVSKARPFLEAGYGVFMCEYRGYGGNPGDITEQGIYRDARAALKWLESNGHSAAQWVIYGESIGSGPAVQMAMEFQPKALVLDAAFSSAADVGQGAYFWLPVSLLLKDRYDNFSKIKSVKSALLMVHGDSDGVVPLPLAHKLYDAANHPKQFVLINGGGHADLFDHGAGRVIVEWLQEQQ